MKSSFLTPSLNNKIIIISYECSVYSLRMNPAAALRSQLSYQETYLVKTGAGMWTGRGRMET